VNCQLYSGCLLGKRKLGVVPEGEGLVEVVGESIERRGVGLHGGVGVDARKGDSASVVNLCNEAFREETVGFREDGSSYIREGGGYVLYKGMGGRVGSHSEETS